MRPARVGSRSRRRHAPPRVRCPAQKQEEYKERLRAHGVPCTEVNHHIAYGDGKQAYHPRVLPNDAEAIDEFVNSIYFPDPDGRTFEFAAGRAHW